MEDLKRLRDKADDLFRQLIKLKTGDPGDMVQCPTCGEPFRISEMTIGHAYRRNELSLRWEEEFATLQCGPCNTSFKYEEELRDHLRGLYPEFDDLLYRLRSERMDRWAIMAKIEELKEKLRSWN